MYSEHLPAEVLEAGIKSGRYIQVSASQIYCSDLLPFFFLMATFQPTLSPLRASSMSTNIEHSMKPLSVMRVQPAKIQVVTNFNQSFKFFALLTLLLIFLRFFFFYL